MERLSTIQEENAVEFSLIVAHVTNNEPRGDGFGSFRGPRKRVEEIFREGGAEGWWRGARKKRVAPLGKPQIPATGG